MYKSYRDLGQTPDQEPTLALQEIKSADHKQQLVNSSRVVCIDIYGDWCGPCKVVAPQFAKLAQKYRGYCLCLKENVDLNLSPDVLGVPTFQYYVDGQPVHITTGGNLEEIEGTIKKLISHEQ